MVDIERRALECKSKASPMETWLETPKHEGEDAIKFKAKYFSS
jgi:hypothetical protein